MVPGVHVPGQDSHSIPSVPEVREAHGLVDAARGSSFQGHPVCLAVWAGGTGVPGGDRGGHACPFDISQSRSVTSPQAAAAGGRAPLHHTPPTASDRRHQRTTLGGSWVVSHRSSLDTATTVMSQPVQTASLLPQVEPDLLPGVRWGVGEPGNPTEGPAYLTA